MLRPVAAVSALIVPGEEDLRLRWEERFAVVELTAWEVWFSVTHYLDLAGSIRDLPFGTLICTMSLDPRN
jgi:hypothetical protein